MRDQKVHDQMVCDQTVHGQTARDQKVHDQKIHDQKVHDQMVCDQTVRGQTVRGQTLRYLKLGGRSLPGWLGAACDGLLWGGFGWEETAGEEHGSYSYQDSGAVFEEIYPLTRAARDRPLGELYENAYRARRQDGR
ncbi:MAG: hypothetical protein QM757_09010 [Paludibaculum sp.]